MFNDKNPASCTPPSTRSKLDQEVTPESNHHKLEKIGSILQGARFVLGGFVGPVKHKPASPNYFLEMFLTKYSKKRLKNVKETASILGGLRHDS